VQGLQAPEREDVRDSAVEDFYRVLGLELADTALKSLYDNGIIPPGPGLRQVCGLLYL
jgi:hypothetical protein